MFGKLVENSDGYTDHNPHPLTPPCYPLNTVTAWKQNVTTGINIKQHTVTGMKIPQKKMCITWLLQEESRRMWRTVNRTTNVNLQPGAEAATNAKPFYDMQNMTITEKKTIKQRYWCKKTNTAVAPRYNEVPRYRKYHTGVFDRYSEDPVVTNCLVNSKHILYSGVI